MSRLCCLIFSIFVFIVNGTNANADFTLIRESVKNVLESGDISEICQKQMEYLLENGTVSLMSMIDASSKILYPGMLYGSTQDLGMYDECLKIDEKYENDNILGKYCSGININLMGQSFSESFCIPNGCHSNDLAILYENSHLQTLFPADFSQAYCKTKDDTPPMTNWDTAGITIFSILLVCMILSTIYDGICIRTERKPIEILNAFSIYTNSKKLFTVSKGSREQVQVFAGLRFISMMWVIAGHGMAYYQALPVSNLVAMGEWISKDYIWYITSGPLAVDTFFYISGFLLPYTYIKQMKNVDMVKQAINVPMLYIHRYVRLTPAVFGLWMFVLSIYMHLGSGPLWIGDGNVNSVSPCKNHIVAYFTYVQNYNNYDDMCMLQTWYLSADMQMFIISPIVLIPTAYLIHKHYNRVMLSLLGLVIVTTIIPIIVKFEFKDYSTKNAYDTHSRLCTYFSGFLFGTYMRMNLNKRFILKNQSLAFVINLIVWCLTLAIMFAIVYLYNRVSMTTHYTYNEATIFYSLMRPLWALGLTWIVYSCYHGYGGVIGSFLSNSFMQVGSRLSYSVYLLHPLVMGHYKSVSRVKGYFSSYIAFYEWCGYFIVSLIGAYIWTLMFESPFIIIEKTIFGRAPKKQVEKNVMASQETIQTIA